MAKSNARIAWIDIARGIAILLVLYGHCMRDPMREAYAVLDYSYRVVYVFHMAFFFWMSGYSYEMGRTVFHKEYSGAFLVRKARKQLLPWVLYSALIYAVFQTAMSIPALCGVLANAGYEKLSLGAYCVQALQTNNPWAYHLWFIYVLFLITALVYGLEKLVPVRYRKHGHAALLAACLLGLLLLRYVNLGEWERLLYCFCRYTPFYLLGILMQGKEDRIKEATAWGALGVVYVLARAKFWAGFSGSSIETNSAALTMAVQYGAYIFLPGTFLLLRKIAMFIADKGRAHVKSALQYLGVESFLLYLFHQPFCCAFVGLVLYGKLQLPALLVMLICMALSILVPMCLKRCWQWLQAKQRGFSGSVSS